MVKINNILGFVIFSIIGFIASYIITNKIINPRTNNLILVTDTLYNKIILDSIEYNINKKDSIIINIKNNAKYEIEQAVNADDSVAIKQFYELTSE